MDQFLSEEFDFDQELDLLEAAGPKGADRYFLHSNAHTMAFQKYASQAKVARESGNAGMAKRLRAIGKKHKAAAEALAAIAGHHVDATFARKQFREEFEVENENTDINEVNEDEAEDFNPIRDLVGFAIERKPLEFQRSVQELIRAVAAETIDDLKVQVAESFGDQIDELTGKGKLPGMKRKLEKSWKSEIDKRNAMSDTGNKEAASKHTDDVVAPLGARVSQARALSSAGREQAKDNHGNVRHQLRMAKFARRGGEYPIKGK